MKKRGTGRSPERKKRERVIWGGLGRGNYNGTVRWYSATHEGRERGCGRTKGDKMNTFGEKMGSTVKKKLGGAKGEGEKLMSRGGSRFEPARKRDERGVMNREKR